MQVMSGDSIIIRGPPKGGPPPEKQVNLAFVSAPKVSRRVGANELNPKGTMTEEEAYAWEARELLRKKLVGQEVTVKIEYKVPFGQVTRDCGLVYLSSGESVVESMVLEGLVDVIKRKQNTDNVEYQKLISAEESAISGKKGKHSPAPYSRREVVQDVEDPSLLVSKSFDAIVEHVISGSTMRLQLDVGDNRYQMVTVMLSGIKCPSLGEAYGEEAKFFTESRLLQRDVKVRLDSVSSGGKRLDPVSAGGKSLSFMGSVSRLNNNIAEHLLKEGYAKCMDWTLSSALNPDKLRAAETDAKNRKVRIFKDYNRVKTTTASFVGRVTEVVNADALMIQHVETNEVKKIFLASVRPPPRPEGVNVTRVLYDVPFMFEAREFLRTRLIGKKVKVNVDYVQPKSDQYQEKTCATVTTLDGGVNIAEALIAKGLGKVVRYRPDDESRSSCYDALLDAEMKAMAGKKGIHGNGEKGILRIVDLSNDPSKAKQFLPFLQRGSTDSRRDGLVEFVYSGSRIKVFVPKENCALNLILSGISTPKANEPFSVDTVTFVKNLVYQRPVSITVDAMDKVGNFIGSVFFGNDNKNLAVELLRNGFASIRDERGAELKFAEDEAKGKKMNIWTNYKEEEVVEDNNNEEGEEEEREEEKTNGDSKTSESPAKARVEKKEERKSIIITQVAVDAGTFYAQFVDQGPGLEGVVTELREELERDPPLPGAFTPSKGDVCAAKYSADGLWYRARVEKPLPNKQFQVTFVDYGNQEVVKSSDLVPFPDNKYNTSHFPPAAKLFAIAFIQLPSDESDLVEAREAFLDETCDKVLLMKSEYKDAAGLEHVTLYDKEKDRDIALSLVQSGYLLVNLKERRREKRLQKTLSEYRAAQETAKKKRVCIIRY